ncbi:uncharacterized protein [Antedon mediterranea]|uniref:uncharacterized protein n=1 Tax=Antedon mediterranea TaxID=105859 RepID=UPI003AF4B005
MNVSPSEERVENEGLEQINERVKHVFNEYLKEKEEDGDFVIGYVEGSEILYTFLEDYKRAGGVGFSIRDSWRRSGLTTQLRLREFEPGKSLADVNDNRSPDEDTAKPQTDVRSKQSGQKCPGALETQCRILWQSRNGWLKLPNLGMPFIIQAYERRVCSFKSTRRVKKDPNKTSDDAVDVIETDALEVEEQEPTDACGSSRKRHCSKIVDNESSKKKRRKRKSIKKDCKAVIELKELWIFAEYKPTFAEDSTDHAKRKAREKIINRLQNEMKSGKVKYLKRYYLRLPYPKVHSGHDIGMNNKLCKINPFVVTCIQNLVNEGITAIKNVQHHINQLVELECAKKGKRYLFGLSYDRSYYPDEKTVRNHIYLAVNAQKAQSQDETERPSSPKHVRLLSNTASNVRSELKEIKNLTQKCQDVQLLTELLQQIENIRKQFHEKLDKKSSLPRKPIPCISTQDSHAGSHRDLNEDGICKNSEEMDMINTDLAAAEVLQSLTTQSFTNRDDSGPKSFDNITSMPDMFQEIVDMMPQQQNNQQSLLQNHQINNLQQPISLHTSQSQKQNSQLFSQNPQEQLSNNSVQLMPSYMAPPSNNDIVVATPIALHCSNSYTKNDISSKEAIPFTNQ